MSGYGITGHNALSDKRAKAELAKWEKTEKKKPLPAMTVGIRTSSGVRFGVRNKT